MFKMTVLRPRIDVYMFRHSLNTDSTVNYDGFVTTGLDISKRVVEYPDIMLKTSDAEGTPFQYSFETYDLVISNLDGLFNPASDTNSHLHKLLH